MIANTFHWCDKNKQTQTPKTIFINLVTRLLHLALRVRRNKGKKEGRYKGRNEERHFKKHKNYSQG